MSLLEQFEESGKEVYQVTQKEWLNIMYDHFINTCKRSAEEFYKVDKIEIKCFHQSQVSGAIKKGIEVSEEVLKDYAGLKEQILSKLKAEEKKKNSTPILTEELYNTLQEGNKITVNGYKLTVYKKENKSIIARVYRKQKQAVELLIGDRYNIIVGW
jgi:hypothetical protein